MSNVRRLLRLAPLAVLLVSASLLTACSADMTGPSAKKRSGYITTSATVQGASASTSSDSTANAGASSGTGSTGTSGASGNTGTSTSKKNSAKSPNKTLSGYNVPAL